MNEMQRVQSEILKYIICAAHSAPDKTVVMIRPDGWCSDATVWWPCAHHSAAQQLHKQELQV